MAQQTQTVIYRQNNTLNPAWQFYSMPESIVGGANALKESRDQYRDALKFSLEQDRLPEIHEYIEREAEKLGIWIRTPRGAPWAGNSFSEIGHQIAQYPPEDLEWFHRHPTVGGDPVVVPVSPDDRLSSVFAQMTPFDSLIIVMGHNDGRKVRIVWVVVAGPEASLDAHEQPPIGLEELGLSPDSSLAEVFHIATHDKRLTDTALLAPA
jgi:hypothetical protein